MLWSEHRAHFYCPSEWQVSWSGDNCHMIRWEPPTISPQPGCGGLLAKSSSKLWRGCLSRAMAPQTSSTLRKLQMSYDGMARLLKPMYITGFKIGKLVPREDTSRYARTAEPTWTKPGVLYRLLDETFPGVVSCHWRVLDVGFLTLMTDAGTLPSLIYKHTVCCHIAFLFDVFFAKIIHLSALSVIMPLNWMHMNVWVDLRAPWHFSVL